MISPKVIRIKQSLSELSTGRTKQIEKLFTSIAFNKRTIKVNHVNVSRDYIMGISDVYERGTDYTAWRFRTNLKNYYAMYYEKWIPYEKDIYYLDRAYFHVYRTNSERDTVEEYILLHCDVSEPDEADHAKYKQSPHLHLHSAEHPIPKSHIALNNGNLKEILESIDGMHLALKQAIDMIDDQILKPLKEQQEREERSAT